MSGRSAKLCPSAVFPQVLDSGALKDTLVAGIWLLAVRAHWGRLGVPHCLLGDSLKNRPKSHSQEILIFGGKKFKDCKSANFINGWEPPQVFPITVKQN